MPSNLSLANLAGWPVPAATDSGVHALDQLAACTVNHPLAAIGFAKGVNRRLPDSIAIRDVCEVAEDFAPRFANQGKIYHYRVYSSPYDGH